MEMDKKALEKVQERMVRLLSDVKGNSYEEKLKDIGLTTLVKRRERGDAIETLNGFNRVNKDEWFDIEADDRRPTWRNVVIDERGETRRRNILLIETSRLEIRKHYFNVRGKNVE